MTTEIPASSCSDVPGEQPGGDHGVRLRGGPGVAARALHDRVLARHVAAGQDGRHILKCFGGSTSLSFAAAPVSDEELHITYQRDQYVQTKC